MWGNHWHSKSVVEIDAVLVVIVPTMVLVGEDLHTHFCGSLGHSFITAVTLSGSNERD